MFSKKNTTSKIDPEQRELIEKARTRAHQKRRLYQHFIIFLIGSAIFIVLNIIFDVGQNIKPFGIDWFVWAIAIWILILLGHIFNVFITNKFLGKDWEERQIDRLVARQEKRIRQLQQKVERDHPLPENLEFPTDDNTPIEPKKDIDPNRPTNT